jgi:hypothetical protein
MLLCNLPPVESEFSLLQQESTTRAILETLVKHPIRGATENIDFTTTTSKRVHFTQSATSATNTNHLLPTVLTIGCAARFLFVELININPWHQPQQQTKHVRF